MRAAGLFEQGVTPAEIARQVGVSHQIVSDWRAVWRQSGRAGLRGAGRADDGRSWEQSNSTRLKWRWPTALKPTGTPPTCGP